jgi:hypothetical protein
MTDEILSAEGISRREMLKRSAVVGGASAMVWAAPSITTFGARAFGTTGTEITGWSFVAFIVTCGGVDYRAKWNRDGEDAGFEQGGSLPGCPTDFVAAYQAANTGGLDLFTVNPPTQQGDLVTFCITSATCTIKNGVEGGVAKQGTECEKGGVVSGDGKCITFDVSVFS